MARPTRQTPRGDRVGDWRAEPFDDPLFEVAREYANRIAELKGEASWRVFAKEFDTDGFEMDHSVLLKIVDGTVWPDLATIARIGLGKGIWPGPLDH